MNTYCIEVEVSNCLIVPEAQKALFNRKEEDVAGWACYKTLYFDGNNEEEAKEKAIQYMQDEPNLQALTLNTPENPKRYRITSIIPWPYGDPLSPEEVTKNYAFNAVDEQGNVLTWMEASDPKKVKYKKIAKKKLFKGSEPIWNPVLCGHIASTCHLSYTESDRAILESLPEPIMHLHYLWTFECEVGGNGIECFVLEKCGHEIKGCYEALQAVGHKQLAEALGMGIALSLEPDEEGNISAEYVHDVEDLTWFNHFKGCSRYKELHEIDDAFDVYELTNNDLEKKIVAYIKANISDIASGS